MVWLDVDTVAGVIPDWDAAKTKRKKPGRPPKYPDHAIETSITLGMVFHMAARQTEGFLGSLFALLQLKNDVPDHSTISRRKKRLGKIPLELSQTKKPIHLLIDSSGLKVHVGKLRKPPKNRDYRKIHLAVDETTGEIAACDLTSKSARDAARVCSLLGQIKRPLSSLKADAGYDAQAVYEAAENHTDHRSPRVLIPPKKNARLKPKSPTSRERNRTIRSRLKLGKRRWHTKSRYSNRSKVETTFSRYKGIIGPAMKARGLASQRVEARIGAKILNTMTNLGIPDGYMAG